MAQDNPVSNALRLQNFCCRTRTLKDCSHEECLGTIPGYSHPMFFLLPYKIDDFRIHFHGHQLKVFPEYDRGVVSMLAAFSTIILPESRSACTDYDYELIGHNSFRNLMEGIHHGWPPFIQAYLSSI